MRKNGHRGLTFIHKMIEGDFNGGKDNKKEDENPTAIQEDEDPDVVKFKKWRESLAKQ